MNYLLKYLSIILLLVICSSGVHGQNSRNNNKILEYKISQLEEKVESLGKHTELQEKRIEALEKQIEFLRHEIQEEHNKNVANNNISNKYPDLPKWTEKERWKKMHNNMSQREVVELLGEPDKITKDDSMENWNYGKFGSITFDERGVWSWIAP